MNLTVSPSLLRVTSCDPQSSLQLFQTEARGGNGDRSFKVLKWRETGDGGDRKFLERFSNLIVFRPGLDFYWYEANFEVGWEWKVLMNLAHQLLISQNLSSFYNLQKGQSPLLPTPRLIFLVMFWSEEVPTTLLLMKQHLVLIIKSQLCILIDSFPKLLKS